MYVKPVFALLMAASLSLASCSEDIADSSNRDQSSQDNDTTSTDDPNAKPEVNTPIKRERTSDDAINFNQARVLPIRFILKLKQSLDVDIDRSSLANAVKFDQTTVEKIAELQKQWFGETKYGMIDAHTYIKIKDELFKEDGYHALIGPYTAQGAVIVSGIGSRSQVSEDVYKRCQTIVEDYGGFFDTTPGIRNLIAIRGAIIDNDKVRRTNTAELYINNIEKPNAAPDTLIHFSSNPQLNPASGQMPYDDTLLVVWKDSVDNEIQYHVLALPLNVDPGFQGGNANSYDFDGTAHLKDGQYMGLLKRHSTSHFDHGVAVLSACYDDTSIYDLLQPGINGAYNYVDWEQIPSLLEQSPLPRVSYNAITNVNNNNVYNGKVITASGTTEVIRDSHVKGAKCDGIITLEELELAQKIHANRYPTDAELAQEYPELGTMSAKEQWFNDYFVHFNDVESQLINSISADQLYKNYNQSLRSRLFKDIMIRYIDTEQSISVNIHTSPDTSTSSEGCLNIPISNYPDLISALVDATHQTTYLYTLVDASKIKELDNN